MNEHDYAIAVGIRLYSDFEELKTAPQDATRFIEWVSAENGGGVPEKNTKLLITRLETAPDNSIDWKPDQDDITQALIEFGVRKGWKQKWEGRNGEKFLGRRLYFYFAGHGYGHTTTDVGMLMADVATDFVPAKSESLELYRAFFARRALFEEIIFILDCCRDPLPTGIHANGSLRGPIFDLPEATPPLDVAELVVLAAAYGRKAYETLDPGTKETSGVLTRILLMALRDGTSMDDRGRVTPRAIKAYFGSHLDELRGRLSDGSPTSQRPELLGNTIESDTPRELILSLASMPVTIIAPSALSGDLVVLADGRSEVDRRPAQEATTAQPPWIVTLQPSKRYVVRNITEGPGSTAAVIDWEALKETSNVFVYPRGDAGSPPGHGGR